MIFQRIPETKQKAFDLAMEIVGDVNRIAEAFGRGASPDDLMVASWNDLTAMKYVCVFFNFLVIIHEFSTGIL